MTRFQWGNDGLAAEFALTEDGVLRLERLGAPGAQHHPGAPVPLVAVSATGHGRTWSGNRFIHTAIGERLRHKKHRSTHEDGLRTLTRHRRATRRPHPDLVLENCASGGMRMDHALLSRMQVQSTSDQQDLARYASIAAAVPTAVTPEQAAVWAYPQPEDSVDEVAFTMVSALLGRVHLSGRLPELTPEARALVHEAMAVYKEIRVDLPHALPSWPLGLPSWDDPWLALALHTPTTTYLAVWRRGGEPTLNLNNPAGRVDLLYPSTSQAVCEPHPNGLVLTLPTAPSAVLLRLAR